MGRVEASRGFRAAGSWHEQRRRRWREEEGKWWCALHLGLPKQKEQAMSSSSWEYLIIRNFLELLMNLSVYVIFVLDPYMS
ncbi:hypothetical protein CDL15_Pgr017498 [Punica granatum]|uniref:Uncharacterized protein n=1 Tax=Punica granatum TaxID=22663 RepID=A0A218WZ65_PUNGR|nr:hypothetical protein CDL15_Pgr017498 [Punica granatum]